MTGHPALSLPLAAADGLPVGVMLVARHFDDARLLSIAATCERALGWAPDPRPAPGAAP
jgi:amidase